MQREKRKDRDENAEPDHARKHDQSQSEQRRAGWCGHAPAQRNRQGRAYGAML
jgi:hypothetical protein